MKKEMVSGKLLNQTNCVRDKYPGNTNHSFITLSPVTEGGDIFLSSSQLQDFSFANVDPLICNNVIIYS